MLVVDAEGVQPPRLAWRSQVPVNPASIMKLVTTYAGARPAGPGLHLEHAGLRRRPGAQRRAATATSTSRARATRSWCIERLWLLLRRVQGLGIQAIERRHRAGPQRLRGRPTADPDAFDGEGLRPYNAAPDALLVNFKSVVMTFVPNRGAPDRAGELRTRRWPAWRCSRRCRCRPANAATGAARCAPTSATRRACGFAGSFPAACGEKTWAVAYADPRSYAARAVGGLWAEMGGRLKGQVRDGRVPAGLQAGVRVASRRRWPR